MYKCRFIFQFSGNKIDCHYDGAGDIPSSWAVLTDYCWISGTTFVLRDQDAWNPKHEVIIKCVVKQINGFWKKSEKIGAPEKQAKSHLKNP